MAASTSLLLDSDYFTKWVEAIPTIDNKAVTVATVLFKASCIMQIELIAIICCISDFHVCCVMSDNGREFDNKLNDEICKTLGIKRRFITPYHPQVGTQVHESVYGNRAHGNTESASRGSCNQDGRARRGVWGHT